MYYNLVNGLLEFTKTITHTPKRRCELKVRAKSGNVFSHLLQRRDPNKILQIPNGNDQIYLTLMGVNLFLVHPI